MRCRICAYENEDGGRFCTSCGAFFGHVCGACGRPRADTARFCGWCGAPQRDDAHLTEPAGERKQATVLFADIAGSTELISGLDAEQAMERLQPVVMAMARAVRRFDGTVLRTLGDGLKAAFGVPLAREKHALLACQAALAMRDAVAAMDGAPAIRVGLHSGEVVSAAFDTGSAIEREAQGLTVHLASRIEQIAVPGEICMTRACRDLVGAYCDTISLGSRILKGIPGEVETFRLIGMVPAVNSEHFRGLALGPFRGRDAELGMLRQAILDAEQGTGQVIGLSAPPGAGKSRLCFEWSEWCREQEVRVLEARAHVFGQATPLLPVLEVLRAFFRVTPNMDAARARLTIGRQLATIDQFLAADLSLLAEFLGFAEPGDTPPAMDAAGRQARLKDIVARMIKAAGRRTSAIIVEDLHWLDEASQDFLRTIVDAVAETKTVVVLTFRPTAPPPWPLPPYYRAMALAELDSGAMARIVRDLTGPGEELAPVVADVMERAGGNPFFAEELILSLAQTGVLLGHRGHYGLAPSGWRNPVLPATVEAVIGARIDLLPETEKEVLQIGAVIGKEFPLSVLRAVSGFAPALLAAQLDRLVGSEMIQPRDTAMGESYAFRHPLIQEVAYGMQLRSRRTRLHTEVATAIGTLDWGRRDEFAGLLAHHYEGAGLNLKAAEHLQRAAIWIGRTNSARALADWKKMRSLLSDLPRTDDIDRMRGLASGQILSCGWQQGMAADEARLYAEEALAHARRANEKRHVALVLSMYGRILAANGAVDEYMALVNEALAQTDPKADPSVAIMLHGMLTQAYLHTGLLNEALATNDAALETIGTDNPVDGGVVLGLNTTQLLGFDVVHWVRCQRARILIGMGHFAQGESWLGKVLQVEPEKADPVVQIIAHRAAVDLAWYRGDRTAAKWHADAIASFAERSGMPYLSVLALVSRGTAAFVEGDFAAAASHFQSGLEMARRVRTGLELEARLLAHLADTHAHAGELSLAIDTADEAIAVARRHNDRIAECFASIVAANALTGDTRPEHRSRARAYAGRARYLLETTGAGILRPLLPAHEFTAEISNSDPV